MAGKHRSPATVAKGYLGTLSDQSVPGAIYFPVEQLVAIWFWE
jgi:hypothetical protein